MTGIMITYVEAIQELIDCFPDLKAIYENDIEEYKGLPYVFYESVFEKYICDAMSNKETKVICDVFEYIEHLLTNGDNQIKNLIGVAVIESLYFEKNFAEMDHAYSRYYGDLTRKSFEECIYADKHR